VTDEIGDLSPYSVGIDLGTTHCTLSWVDCDLSEGDVVASYDLQVPQLVAPGQTEPRAQLPSFLYLPGPAELPETALRLPWGEAARTSAGAPCAVGELARALGAKTPTHLVSSAKSWLCHAGVDRRGAILPTEAPPDLARLSPLEASVLYLRHLRAAWDAAHPDTPLAAQEVTLTVPASFDPAARELTAEAARLAGLGELVLLEEPQAALYAWIAGSGGAWREQVAVGEVILVVDVGGGTTDFSLIAVGEEEDRLVLTRVAVGEHILLGGDNMDLALAHAVRQKLEASGRALDPWQLLALAHACRAAKERLLVPGGADEEPIVVPSRGARLVGASLRSTLTRAEVEARVLDGFFPAVEATARPAARPRLGLAQLGLPYAQDAAVTRHLAAFLARQAGAAEKLGGAAASARTGMLVPSAVLFNGGVFKAPALRRRVLETLGAWARAAGAPPPRELEGADLDLAVSRGAAYLGFVRRGRGIRIRGGTARSFYIGVESAMPAVPGMEPPIRALCVAPFGMEEGTSADVLDAELGLVVGEPVRFRFFGSSTRRDDAVGAVLDRWNEGELEELAELEAELPPAGRSPGDVVPVRLRASVTEVGVLEIEALPRSGPERWKLSLDVRHGEGA
jgi:molecular chaperone DnaK (HSP70)